MLTVEYLLDTIQELIGEPMGAFYNISHRLKLLSQAQQELVDETNAMLDEATYPVAAGEPDVTVPWNFQRFGDRQPVFVVSQTERHPLRVVPPKFLDMQAPGWRQDETNTGTPRYIVQEGNILRLYPVPDKDGDLEYNYIVIPEELTDLAQIPFDGRPDLNRYALALAYKVAFIITAPRAPQVAQMYEDMYIREEKKMRHFIRTNAQKPQQLYIKHKGPYAPD